MKIYTQTNYSRSMNVRAIVLVVMISIIPFINIYRVNASPITGRSVILSSSVGDATGVSYALTAAALPTTATAVKSVEIKFCTLLIGGCITPSGFSSSASTLASQPTGLGAAAGWTVSAANPVHLEL